MGIGVYWQRNHTVIFITDELSLFVLMLPIFQFQRLLSRSMNEFDKLFNVFNFIIFLKVVDFQHHIVSDIAFAGM